MPLKQIARASREGARGESTKRCGQRAGAEHTSGSNRRSCAFKQSATPSVEIAAALASTMARRSLKVVAAVGPSPAFACKALPNKARHACDEIVEAVACAMVPNAHGLQEPRPERWPL